MRALYQELVNTARKDLGIEDFQLHREAVR